MLQVNVLISDNHQALLTDFGYSVAVNSSFSMTMPSQGGIKGTWGWMAPEILDGSNVSAEADVWAFGMTALVRHSLFHLFNVKGKSMQELFTREEPYRELHTIAAIATSIARGRKPNCPSAEDTCQRMTYEWWDICSRCWEYNPASRPTTLRIVEKITKIVRSSPVAKWSVTYLPS